VSASASVSLTVSPSATVSPSISPSASAAACNCACEKSKYSWYDDDSSSGGDDWYADDDFTGSSEFGSPSSSSDDYGSGNTGNPSPSPGSTTRNSSLSAIQAEQIKMMLAQSPFQSVPLQTGETWTIKVAAILSASLTEFTDRNKRRNAAARGEDASSNYHGLAVDLLRYIVANARDMNPALGSVNPVLNLQTVKSYGSRANGSWTGAIGGLLRAQYDMGVGMFPVTSNLTRTGMDFSVPFLSTGFSTLTRYKPIEPPLWAFLGPFSPTVWLAIIVTVFATMTLAWAVDLVTPFGWTHVATSPEDKRNLALVNALWSGMLALFSKDMMEIRAMSTRVCTVAVVFFIYFMMRAYTSSLTAILTVRDLGTEVTGWEDLRDRRLLWGAVAESPAAQFFSDTESAELLPLVPQMILYDNLTEAESALRQGSIAAVIAESLTVKYAALFPPCELTTVGPDISSQQIAFPFSSKAPAYLRQLINDGIAQAMSSHVVAELYRDYFMYPGSCALSPTNVPVDEAISLKELTGVVYAFLLLLLTSVILLGFEWFVFHMREKYSFFAAVSRFLGFVDEHVEELARLNAEKHKMDLGFGAMVRRSLFSKTRSTSNNVTIVVPTVVQVVPVVQKGEATIPSRGAAHTTGLASAPAADDDPSVLQ
jgi:ABC-type amino acid transport substrate-binding protein